VTLKRRFVTLFIVLKPGETATEAEILDFCRANLAGYKVPKWVEFRESLPKTAVGKILRRSLVAEERTRREAAAEPPAATPAL
jgi:long-chain acyl-CoA synthetase